MAINFTVTYTFAPNTTIASAQVNTNVSDEANVWTGLEAKTKTFSNLGIDTQLKSGGTVEAANGTVAAPAITFTNSTGSGLYRIGADDIGFATAGVIALEINSAQAVIAKGVATNSSAAAGYIGEYVSSSVGSASPPTSGNYGDVTSISLTAGDWDVTGIVYFSVNGATITDNSAGISVTTGNSSTGLTAGDTLISTAKPAVGFDTTAVIPAVRASIASTTTYYLKVHMTYSVATPIVGGRISARRVR